MIYNLFINRKAELIFRIAFAESHKNWSSIKHHTILTNKRRRKYFRTIDLKNDTFPKLSLSKIKKRYFLRISRAFKKLKFILFIIWYLKWNFFSTERNFWWFFSWIREHVIFSMHVRCFSWKYYNFIIFYDKLWTGNYNSKLNTYLIRIRNYHFYKNV